jgi:ABC-type multidrug transport system fused ATPase/permease subunit
MKINLNLHEQMVKGVLNTRMKFFEVNTVGRIINRFTGDVSVSDSMVFTFLEMIDVITYLLDLLNSNSIM